MAIIYLADRDDAFRKALAHGLRQCGHEIVDFESGSELYARAVTGEPDLIALETDLEDMDGFQVFARLQRKRPDRPFPVVFVTEFQHPRVARVLKQKGALGVVGKDQSLEQVVERIQSIVTERDPLYKRKLSAALAWLQSRGKSGRLEVEADGNTGYVLLHKGKVLEAKWKTLEGDSALTLFAEGLPEAKFQFAEGLDEAEAIPDVEEAVGAGEWKPDLPAVEDGHWSPVAALREAAAAWASGAAAAESGDSGAGEAEAAVHSGESADGGVEEVAAPLVASAAAAESLTVPVEAEATSEPLTPEVPSEPAPAPSESSDVAFLRRLKLRRGSRGRGRVTQPAALEPTVAAAAADSSIPAAGATPPSASGVELLQPPAAPGTTETAAPADAAPRAIERQRRAGRRHGRGVEAVPASRGVEIVHASRASELTPLTPPQAFTEPAPKASVPDAGARTIAVGGAVTAAQELLERYRRKHAGRLQSFSGRQRVTLGIAAALVLLLTAGVAVAALFPDVVPAGLSAMLRGHAIPASEREVREPAPQLARATPDDASPVVQVGASDADAATPSRGSEPDAAAAAIEPETPRSTERAPAAEDRPNLADAAAERRARDAEALAARRTAELEARRRAAAAAADEKARQTPRVPTPRVVEAGPVEERVAFGRELEPDRPSVPALVVADAPTRREEPAAAVAPETREPSAAAATPTRRRSAPTSRRTTPAAAGIVKKAVLLHRGSEPYYPPELRAEGISGTVVLAIRIGTDGRAQQVLVERPSGYEAFDQAAVASVGTFLWDPAQDAHGPTETWINQAVTFKP